ncbi:hypothetical protein DM860_008908 [Cuscuta australis]|uniref:HAT C-terminal dimerisation domain-containing protein n=1 Tax=Cuscuta australis TaxID=267555 RepID=A0A328D8B7_9ASTE|nr:hypothetical protein DM860_008908 [Cuscuta australis]
MFCFSGIVGGLLAKKGKRAQSSTSSSGTTVSSHNEFAMYQGVPCDYDDDDVNFDVLGWWKQNEHMFPCLGMLARQVLSVPVSTIAVEREFSAGGNILTDYRSCLNAESPMRDKWVIRYCTRRNNTTSPPKSKKGFAGIVGGLLAKKGKRAQSSTSSSGTTNIKGYTVLYKKKQHHLAPKIKKRFCRNSRWPSCKEREACLVFDEFKWYKGVPCDYDDDDVNFDVLGWWKRNEHMFPCLGMLARQVLSVPVSTVAVEREFSAGGNILTDYRSCLNAESLETLVCNQDWLLARRRAQESSYQLESEHYMNATTDESPSSEE